MYASMFVFIYFSYCLSNNKNVLILFVNNFNNDNNNLKKNKIQPKTPQTQHQCSSCNCALRVPCVFCNNIML